MIPALLLGLGGLLSARAADRLWLDGVVVGEVASPRPGRTSLGRFSVGGRPMASIWNGPGDRPALSPAPASGDWLPSRRELVVVIPSWLVAESTLLYRFLDAREAEGWAVTVATEADWAAGDGDRAGQLRDWLARRYADAPGAYLLLVGDPDPDGHDGVPMLRVHPLSDVARYYPDWLAEELDPIPTDFLYAELEASWDCDGDGALGEYPDDAQCMDAGPELFAGRLPALDAGELDEMLARLLARDQEEDRAHRTRVLLPGALFSIEGAASPTGGSYDANTDGASILDRVYADLPPAFQAGATWLYEDARLVTSVYAHDGALDRDEVVAAWAPGRGLVVWAGHGGTDAAYRMVWDADDDGDGYASEDELDYPTFVQSSDAWDLALAPGAFTWHVSCDNGFPEDPGNIGKALLLGGAVATATASRPAFGVTPDWGEDFEPRPDLATASTAGWAFALAMADGVSAGEALAWTKYALPGDGWTEAYPGYDFTGAAWATRVEFNLYGDPTRSLELCQSDADCEDQSLCNGADTCVMGEGGQGVCHHGALVDCSHLDDDCSVGMCDDATATCTAWPRLDGATCDDGLWCTEADTCRAGSCEGEPRACGERDGYEAVCVEESQTCAWEELAAEGEGRSGCASAPVREAPAWIPLVLLALRRRLRSRA